MPLSKFTIEDSRQNHFSSTQNETKLPLFQQLQLLFYKQQSCTSAPCIMISLLLNKRLYRQLQAQKFTVTLNEGLFTSINTQCVFWFCGKIVFTKGEVYKDCKKLKHPSRRNQKCHTSNRYQ